MVPNDNLPDRESVGIWYQPPVVVRANGFVTEIPEPDVCGYRRSPFEVIRLQPLHCQSHGVVVTGEESWLGASDAIGYHCDCHPDANHNLSNAALPQ
jgi:hypothetical protein